VFPGYLGSDDAWSDFEDEWHEVLHDTSIGGRSIEYFHMHECYKLENEFAPFTRRQANTKLYALVDTLRPLLRSKRLREFTCTIDWDVFKRATSNQIKEVFYSPYLFAFGTLVIETARCVKDTRQREPIYFFMDDQIPLIEKSVAGQFAHAKVTMPDEMAGLFDAITFRSDKFCYPLQAADLIAWQRHRRELNLTEDRGARPEWKRLHNAIPLDQPFMFPYKEAGLIEFCQRTEAKLRAKGLIQ